MPTAAPNQYTFQKKTLPHGKEMIGYWHGNTQRASTMTPNQIDYSKLSRINYATFTTNENGKIYIRGKKNGSLNNEAEIVTLLGPYVWHPPNDGSSKEYCTANPNNGNAGCMHHDYQQGMLHLAHLSGVEVYPSITLDTNQSLLQLDKEEFTKNAIQLLEDYEFDGLDIHFEMSSLTGGQEDEAEAFQSLLSHLRREMIKLMYNQSKKYGISVVMSCLPDVIQHQDIVQLDMLVDELNLLSFNLNTATSSDVSAPHAPLYTDPSESGDYHSVHACVNSWLIGGISQDKINVGLSFYGQTYKGTTEMYAEHDGVDTAHWTNNGDEDKDGSVPYYSIYPRLQEDRVDSLTTVREDVTKTEYAFFEHNSDGGLVSYEDERSLCDKAEYGIANQLNGHFIW